MLTEEAQTIAFAKLHAALCGWSDGTLSFEEFDEHLQQLTDYLDEHEQED